MSNIFEEFVSKPLVRKEFSATELADMWTRLKGLYWECSDSVSDDDQQVFDGISRILEDSFKMPIPEGAPPSGANAKIDIDYNDNNEDNTMEIDNRKNGNPEPKDFNAAEVAEYFDKLAEVERKLDEYIRVVSSMLTERSLDLAELTMRTQIVALPVNTAMQMSEFFLSNAKGMLLPPTSDTHSPNLLRLLDEDLLILLSRIANLDATKLSNHRNTNLPILKNNSLKLFCDNVDGNFAEVIRGLVVTSKSLADNIRQIDAIFCNVEPSVVNMRFNDLYRDFKARNAYIVDDILTEVKDPSVAIADLNKEYAGNDVVRLWKKYKMDIPTLIAELRKRHENANSLDQLFDYMVRYEQLLSMNKDFDVQTKTVNIQYAQIGNITTQDVSIKGTRSVDAEVVKASIKRLMDATYADANGKRKKLFSKQYQWFSVYAVLLDYRVVSQLDYAGFVRMVNAMFPNPTPKIDTDTLSHSGANFGKHPFSQWNNLNVHFEKDSIYQNYYVVAKRYHEIILETLTASD